MPSDPRPLIARSSPFWVRHRSIRVPSRSVIDPSASRHGPPSARQPSSLFSAVIGSRYKNIDRSLTTSPAIVNFPVGRVWDGPKIKESTRDALGQKAVSSRADGAGERDCESQPMAIGERHPVLVPSALSGSSAAYLGR